MIVAKTITYTTEGITYIKHITDLDKNYYFCHTINDKCKICGDPNEKEQEDSKEY